MHDSWEYTDSHITVADDLALVSDPKDEMQYMLEDSGGFANQEHYIIHPTKSGMLVYGNGSKPNYDFTMFNKPIKIEQHCTHLGIFRDNKIKVNIEEKVGLARKIAYALMGAGLHAGNGVTKSLCAYMWSTYVIPRLVYGLEVQNLSRTDIESLERFQRKCLRQIQGLPDKTPNCVTLSLMGVPPVETIIHKNILNLFVNSARSQSSVEYDIIEKQLVMKSSDESSWCNEVKRILCVYGLPSAYKLFFNPPLLKTLGSLCKKKSLKYLNPKSVVVGIPHICWSSVRYNIRDNRRAEMEVKILTGTYILHTNRASFNQYSVDQTCKVCQEEPEDRAHFIARCESLDHVRQPYKHKLENVFMDIIPNVKDDYDIHTTSTGPFCLDTRLFE